MELGTSGIEFLSNRLAYSRNIHESSRMIVLKISYDLYVA